MKYSDSYQMRNIIIVIIMVLHALLEMTEKIIQYRRAFKQLNNLSDWVATILLKAMYFTNSGAAAVARPLDSQCDHS